MKLAFCADIHLGNHKRFGGPMKCGINRRCLYTLETLQAAIKIAEQEGCEGFVIAGDVFDTNKPPPQLIACVQEILHSTEIPTVIIKGNHDSASSDLGDHALGPLAPVAAVVDAPNIYRFGKGSKTPIDLICVPYQEGKAIEWFPKEIKKLKPGFNKGALRLLSFHLGVEDDQTSHFLQGAKDAIPKDVVEDIMEAYKITYSFAGNWHDHRHWYVLDGKSGIVQCGTLCPTGWDNEGTEDVGTLVVYDTSPPKKRGFATVLEVPGPRFLDVNGPKADTLLKNIKAEGNKLFVRWKCEPEEMKGATETLKAWRESGLIVEGGAVPDDVEEEVEARHAATAARSAETLDEALANYVERMPLEPIELPTGQEWEPERPDILDRSRKLLQEAGQ